MSKVEEISQYFKSLIGIKKETSLGEIDAIMIKRYARSVGEDNPIYYDQAYAQKMGYPDLIAPPNMITSIIEWTEGVEEHKMFSDGTTKDVELPSHMRNVRIMGGGESIKFFKPVIAGMRIFLESEIIDSYIKKGKSGEIAFHVIKNIYKNEMDEILCISNRTMIAR